MRIPASLRGAGSCIAIVFLLALTVSGCASLPTDPPERAVFEQNNDPLEPLNRNILDINQFVTDKFIRTALSQVGRDYDAELKNYAQLPLKAKDATTGADITDFSRVAQIWVKDEPKLRHFNSPENALKALAALEKEGKTIRVVYAQDRESGIKLFANQANLDRPTPRHSSFH